VNVEVIVPFGGEDRYRLLALKTVCDHLRDLPYPFRVVHDLEADRPFSLSRARNRGAAESAADLLVFNDGDTIVPAGQIILAVGAAKDAPGPVVAFTDYLRLDRQGQVVASLHAPPSLGCIAMSRATWEELPFDERFEGWGYEDCTFNLQASKRWPARRVPGIAFHLWHGERNVDDSPADADPVLVAANLTRFEEIAHENVAD